MNESNPEQRARENQIFEDLSPKTPSSHHIGDKIMIYIKPQKLNNNPITLRRDVYDNLDEFYQTGYDILIREGEVILLDDNKDMTAFERRGELHA
ncbi:MAG: hypothetical protein Q7J09_11065 [Methanocalculus sp.]|uniref:hypothetical protein n=1 Tax=Methanocalculus sp. TaxID=2004547 RepID=UPI002727E1DA|nr:hypothetical protein [Methanocalculus sp.]MDO9540522.1 hypothetical protein [Methanocalculus sp.]